jgi:hypothetical protein
VIVDEKGLEIAKRDLLLARLELAALGLLWHDQIINMRPSPGGLVNNGLVKIDGAAHPRDNQLHQRSYRGMIHHQ